MRDPQLSQAELDAATAAAGMDELFLGEHTSMEVLAVPHFRSTAAAPPPLEGGALFEDHFASSRSGADEEEHEAEIMQQDKNKAEAEENKEGETEPAGAGAGGKKSSASPKANKRRKQ